MHASEARVQRLWVLGRCSCLQFAATGQGDRLSGCKLPVQFGTCTHRAHAPGQARQLRPHVPAFFLICLLLEEAP
jgi:hypothetical protein